METINADALDTLSYLAVFVRVVDVRGLGTVAGTGVGSRRTRSRANRSTFRREALRPSAATTSSPPAAALSREAFLSVGCGGTV